MDCQFDRLRARVPKDKFYPPIYDSANCLLRQKLLKEYFKKGQSFPRLLYVEGQAGQGKSTLAVQGLTEAGRSFVWYQLTVEDQDPLFLATAFLVGLQDKLDGFSAPQLEKILASGEAAAAEVQVLAEMLADALSFSIPEGLCLVFDDLHHLSSSLASFVFLQTVVERAPTGLSMVFLSREKPADAWEPLLAAPGAFLVENIELELDKTEIAFLFNELFRVPLSGVQVQELHRATEGWIAGLLIAGHALQNQSLTNTEGMQQILAMLLKEGAIDFFRAAIFSQVSDSLRLALCKLSFLEEIPLPLAKGLTNVVGIEEVLELLLRQNFFLRSLDDQNQLMALHALFREFLQRQAKAELTQGEIAAIFQKAGGYFLEKGDPVKALRYLLQANDFDAVETILRQAGMALLAVNRIITLQRVLQQIPEEVILQYPWLTFYAAVVRMDHHPATSYAYLQQARDGFVACRDELGEMFTLTQQMHYHVSIDARHNLGRDCLERVEELFEKFGESLDLPGQVRMTQALAAGHCFFDYDMVKTDTFSDLALAWSEGKGLDNKSAATRAIRCYRHAFVGNWPGLRAEIEKTFPYFLNSRVSAHIKLTLLITQASWLILEGNFPAYGRAKELLQAAAGKNLLAQSVAAPFLLIYDAYRFLAQGQWTRLEETVRQGLALQGVGASPHHQSQFLHFQALICSWQGDEAGARQAAEESRRMRLEIGPGRFDALNQIVLGAAFIRLGCLGEAASLLNAACSIAAEYGDNFLLSSSRFHRAQLHRQMGAVEDTREDLAQGLALMKANGYVFFFGWMPEVLEPLLVEAVLTGIESDYARKLAAERLDMAILVDGSTIPLLHICSLGELTCSLRGEVRVREADLSPAQRELLALLLSSPGRRVSQEQLQEHLWPDSSPEKSRSKFDTLLSRLRKTLDPLLQPVSVKHYLSLQKGILCLENCRVDAEGFVAIAKAGLRHAQKEEFVQAGLALEGAVALWQGPYLEGLPGNDAVAVVRYELEALYLKTVCLWGKLLARAGQTDRVVDVAASALRLDPTHHGLVQLLYGLYTQSGDPVQAGKVIRSYRQRLEREDYSPEDVEQALESLWSSAS
jgi:ATP/maltotriose-dependent transcriptional regulator MalT/DNA-binding SARP family transcriptional activator